MRNYPGKRQFNEVATNIQVGYGSAEWLYAKPWGALPFYGKPEEEAAFRRGCDDFRVDGEKMALTDGARFPHL